MSRYYKAKDVETVLVFSGLCDGKTCKEVKEVLNSIPAIATKQIKYFDEDENVWKTGEVIVRDSEKPNNSTISKMEQVETMSCAECKHRPIGAEICEEPCHYEPQTDWHYDEQDATWYPYKHEDEPQQKSCATCKHALGNWDGESNNCGRCCGADRRFYEPIEDEPQTERSRE